MKNSSMFAEARCGEYLNLILTIDSALEEKIKASLEQAAEWLDDYTVKNMD